jgi:hypothetical protein
VRGRKGKSTQVESVWLDGKLSATAPAREKRTSVLR